MGVTPQGWRNPGWICQPYCVTHLSKVFKYSAVHYQHNRDFQWGCKMIFGADGIHETNINIHGGNNIMFQSHIFGDWNQNTWTDQTYNQIRLSLAYLVENYEVQFKTIQEI